MGEDIRRVFNTIFESNTEDAPGFFDLAHIGVDEYAVLGWYTLTLKNMKSYFYSPEFIAFAQAENINICLLLDYIDDIDNLGRLIDSI